MQKLYCTIRFVQRDVMAQLMWKNKISKVHIGFEFVGHVKIKRGDGAVQPEEFNRGKKRLCEFQKVPWYGSSEEALKVAIEPVRSKVQTESNFAKKGPLDTRGSSLCQISDNSHRYGITPS